MKNLKIYKDLQKSYFSKLFFVTENIMLKLGLEKISGYHNSRFSQVTVYGLVFFIFYVTIFSGSILTKCDILQLVDDTANFKKANLKSLYQK